MKISKMWVALKHRVGLERPLFYFPGFKLIFEPLVDLAKNGPLE